MKTILKLILTLLLITSCDESSKPSSSYLIENTIKSSAEEQIIESGSDFKMIFPANSITGNLEVKVKKESSVPAMNIPNQKPGKNFYRIKFSGDTEFQKPVNIIINFDKSAIPTGKTAQESVFGYIYSSGTWKLANYQLDEPNGKIIISISSILGKTYKDEPILLDNGEIVIGGFTTTDDGQNDGGILSTFRYYFMNGPSLSVRTQKYDDVSGSLISDNTITGGYDFLMLTNVVMKNESKWINKQFSINYDTTKPGSKLKYDVLFKLADDLKSIKEFTCFYEYTAFHGYSEMIQSHFRLQFRCFNIPLLDIYGGDYFSFIKEDQLNESFFIDFFTEKEYTNKGILVKSKNYNTINYDTISTDMKQYNKIYITFQKD